MLKVVSHRKVALIKLRIILALIMLRMRLSLIPRKTISGRRVASISVMIILVGLSPITINTIMAQRQSTKALKIRSGGSVVPSVGLGVYWNSGCSSPVSSIDWGSIDPGTVKNVVVYVRNEGKGKSAVSLYLDASSWEPEAASNYMTLSWDYDGQPINPDEVIRVTLTLSVSSSTEGIDYFRFDILITASK